MSQAADPFELARTALQGTRGGHRPGAGRKPGSKDSYQRSYTKGISELEAMLAPPAEDFAVEFEDDIPGVAEQYAKARADKETALARRAELKLQVEMGQYLPREAYMMANAKAQQACAQAIRSIPDMLEQKAGITPDQAVLAADAIENCLEALEAAMREFFDKATHDADEAERLGE